MCALRHETRLARLSSLHLHGYRRNWFLSTFGPRSVMPKTRQVCRCSATLSADRPEMIAINERYDSKLEAARVGGACVRWHRPNHEKKRRVLR